MKINFIILSSLFIMGFIASGLFQQTTPTIQKFVQVEEKEQKIPDFQFFDMAGREHHISDYAGKTIILNFWASWCAPCVVEFPLLLESVAVAQGPVILIAISSDSDKNSVERFLSKLDKKSKELLKEKNIIIGLDTDKSITNDLFQTVSLPETIIIDPDQWLKKKIIGRVETINDVLLALE